MIDTILFPLHGQGKVAAILLSPFKVWPAVERMMRRIAFLFFLYLTISFSFPFIASGDIIVLKNGEAFRGRVVEKTEKEIILKVQYGRIIFEVANIEDIISESWGEDESGEKTEGKKKTIKKGPSPFKAAGKVPASHSEEEDSAEKKKGPTLQDKVDTFMKSPFEKGFLTGLRVFLPKRDSSRFYFYCFTFLATFFFIMVGCRFSNFENWSFGKGALLTLATFFLGCINFVAGDVLKGTILCIAVLSGEVLLWLLSIILIFQESIFRAISLIVFFVLSFSLFSAFVFLLISTIII